MNIANGLPDYCYGTLPSAKEIILLKRGEIGYHPARNIGIEGSESSESSEERVKALNEQIGVTPAQAEAMRIGSLFGWGVPGADPAIYDENGAPKKLRLFLVTKSNESIDDLEEETVLAVGETMKEVTARFRTDYWKFVYVEEVTEVDGHTIAVRYTDVL